MSGLDDDESLVMEDGMVREEDFDDFYVNGAVSDGLLRTSRGVDVRFSE